MLSFSNFLLNENASFSDIKDALSDSNIMIGIEFEFYLESGEISEFSTNSIVDDAQHAYNQLRVRIVDYLYKLGKAEKYGYISEYKYYVEDHIKELRKQIKEYEQLGDEDSLDLAADLENEIIEAENAMDTAYDLYIYIREELSNDDIDDPGIYALNAVSTIPSVPDELIDFYDTYGGINVARNQRRAYLVSDAVFELYEDEGDFPSISANDVLDKIFHQMESPNTYEYEFGNGEFDEETMEGFFDSFFPFKDNYQFGKDSSYRTWAITTDDSVPSSQGGVEIISPTMPITQMMGNNGALSKMLKFIREHGYTKGGHSGGTGMHVNLSYKGKRIADLDKFKLMLFMDEGTIERNFDGRLDSGWADSVYDALLRGETPDNSLQKTSDMERVIGKWIAKTGALKKIPFGKFFGVNVTNDNRIEFRYIGGENYEKKEREIQSTIGKYAYYLKLGFDPKMKSNEYVKKVVKLRQRSGVDDVKSKSIYPYSDIPSKLKRFMIHGHIDDLFNCMANDLNAPDEDLIYNFARTNGVRLQNAYFGLVSISKKRFLNGYPFTLMIDFKNGLECYDDNIPPGKYLFFFTTSRYSK